MSEGIRWHRRDDMDELGNQPGTFRLDILRELVDELPEKQKHIIERTFFGGAPLLEAAAELKVSPKHARELRAAAFDHLRDALLCHNGLGWMLADAVATLDGRPVPIARIVEDAWHDAGPVLRGEDL